jgi:hypothetical protein
MKPKKYERKKHFIKRCIPYVFDNEPDILTSKNKKSKQSYAICNSIFDKNNENFEMFKTYSSSKDKFNNLKNELYELGSTIILNKGFNNIKVYLDGKLTLEVQNDHIGMKLINIYLKGLKDGILK